MTHPRFLIALTSLVFLSACSTPGTPGTPAPSNPVDTTKKTDAVYSLSDIAGHRDKSDCWVAIHGNVYNVTPSSSSGKHPGGDAILAGCGIDATTLFETRPMGSGTPHSDKAKGYLENFKIGTLKK